MSDVFWTVLTGTATYVLGQFSLKWIVDPVHDLKKTIGVISHSLFERANVIANPGQFKPVVMDETSQELKNLASQLQSHLYLIPYYPMTACLFRLPPLTKILAASKALTGLSSELHKASEHSHGINATHIKTVYDSLRIYNEP